MNIGSKKFSRREVLKFGALAGGSLLLPIGLERRGYAKGAADSPVTKPFTLDFKRLPVLRPVKSTNTPGSNGEQDFEGTNTTM